MVKPIINHPHNPWDPLAGFPSPNPPMDAARGTSAAPEAAALNLVAGGKWSGNSRATLNNYCESTYIDRDKYYVYIYIHSFGIIGCLQLSKERTSFQDK